MKKSSSKHSSTKSSTRRIGTRPKNGSKKSRSTRRKSSGNLDTDVQRWTLKKLDVNSFEIRAPLIRKKGWKFRVLLSSDRHIDSPDSDLILQKRHLDEATEINAPVIDGGDLFDVMQSRQDKRASKGGIRPEHNTDTYIDDVIRTTAAFLAPYAEQMPILLSGNHDVKSVELLETSMMDRLVERVRMMTDAEMYHAGYGAAISFAFMTEGTPKSSMVHNLWIEHGAGKGGASISELTAKAKYFPDFHIMASGHTHNKAQESIQRLRRGRTGKLYEDEMLLLKLCTYKKEHKGGHSGWHVRRGAPPKPTGAWWLEFYYDSAAECVKYRAIAA